MQYSEQTATLTDLTVEDSPERYDLCGAHADRTRPPRGWALDDDRSEDGADLDMMRGPRSVDDTVAILAAALRDDQSGVVDVSPPAPTEHTLDVPLEDEVSDRLDSLAEPTLAEPTLAEPTPLPGSDPLEASRQAPPAPPTPASWPVPAARRESRG